MRQSFLGNLPETDGKTPITGGKRILAGNIK